MGIAIMLYPPASNYLAEKSQGGVIEEYREKVATLSEIEQEEEREKANEYNQRLMNNVVLTDPFDAQTMVEGTEEYRSILNLRGDGVMGYIEVPSIDIYIPVYHGTSNDVLSKGVGHLVNTSLPVGGKGTHTVLSAHRGLPSARLFTDLDKLEKGEKFYLHILGETLAYEIDQIKISEPHDIEDLLIDREHEYATLVTCTPYAINSHRLLVRGHRVPYVEEEKEITQEIKTPSLWRGEYLLALNISVVIASIIVRVRKRKTTNEK